MYGRKRGVLSKLSPIVKFMQLVLKIDVEMSPFQDDGSNPSHPSFELNRRTILECLIFQRSSGAALSTMSANVLLTESINMEVSENDQSISCAIVFFGICRILEKLFNLLTTLLALVLIPIVPFCIGRLVQWSPGQVMCSSSSLMRLRVSL